VACGLGLFGIASDSAENVSKYSSTVHTVYQYSLTFRYDTEWLLSGNILSATKGVKRRLDKEIITKGMGSAGSLQDDDSLCYGSTKPNDKIKARSPVRMLGKGFMTTNTTHKIQPQLLLYQ
jgi:hypothetical protein